MPEENTEKQSTTFDLMSFNLKSPRGDSNSRPVAYEATALPLSYEGTPFNYTLKFLFSTKTDSGFNIFARLYLAAS